VKEVYDFILNNTSLNNGDYVVIGTSGGPDSMVLLHHLMNLKDKLHFNIVVAHVHHNIRKESDEEALMVEDYCRDNELLFEFRKLEYDKFSESLGHKMRYDFFEELINKYHAKYLFTAHHGDDLIETVLMRIVRGSNLKGYAGYEPVIDNGFYKTLRPLVCVTKDDIMDYINKYNIPYVIDESNNNTIYTRNRYRHNILPVLKQEDRNVHLKFLKYNQTLLEYSNYIDEQVDKIYDDIVINKVVNIHKLVEQHRVITTSLISRWLYSIYGDDITLITYRHLENIVDLVYSNKPNIIISLPNYKFIKKYDTLSIYEDSNITDYEFTVDSEVVLPTGHKISIISNTDSTSNFVTHLNSDSIKLPLIVRNYHVGDKMTIKNMEGHKKISDIFTDEKIDISKRSSYPVVLDSTGEIIWLPGIKKSSFDNHKEGKYDIILEYR
jgi:tRNA(Ile)-lysidine synthase